MRQGGRIPQGSRHEDRARGRRGAAWSRDVGRRTVTRASRRARATAPASPRRRPRPAGRSTRGPSAARAAASTACTRAESAPYAALARGLARSAPSSTAASACRPRRDSASASARTAIHSCVQAPIAVPGVQQRAEPRQRALRVVGPRRGGEQRVPGHAGQEHRVHLLGQTPPPAPAAHRRPRSSRLGPALPGRVGGPAPRQRRAHALGQPSLPPHRGMPAARWSPA